jgi:hypothetical protein
MERVVFLPRSSLFMVGKTQKLHGARYGLHRLDGRIVGFLITFSKPNTKFNRATPTLH